MLYFLNNCSLLRIEWYNDEQHVSDKLQILNRKVNNPIQHFVKPGWVDIAINYAKRNSWNNILVSCNDYLVESEIHNRIPFKTFDTSSINRAEKNIWV